MFARTALLVLLASALFASALSAQEDWFARPRAHLGVNFILSDPIGEFDQFVGTGAGADFFGRCPWIPWAS